jgi:hypothetical protein
MPFLQSIQGFSSQPVAYRHFQNHARLFKPVIKGIDRSPTKQTTSVVCIYLNYRILQIVMQINANGLSLSALGFSPFFAAVGFIWHCYAGQNKWHDNNEKRRGEINEWNLGRSEPFPLSLLFPLLFVRLTFWRWREKRKKNIGCGRWSRLSFFSLTVLSPLSLSLSLSDLFCSVLLSLFPTDFFESDSLSVSLSRLSSF